jgi:hypothetical protein
MQSVHLLGLTALICTLVVLGLCRPACASTISNADPALSLSDDGYAGIIHFRAPTTSSSIRTKYIYQANITAGDRCRAFYDIESLLTDDDIKGFADIALNQLTSKMRLAYLSAWDYNSYNRRANDLQVSLERGDRKNLYIGMSVKLTHDGKFTPSTVPPHSLIPDSDGQDCYFDVQLQYFFMLDAPAFTHIIVLDTTPQCGSPRLNDGNFDLKKIDRVGLKKWIDSFGIQREYQDSLDARLKQFQSLSVRLADDLKRIHDNETYKDSVKHCHDSLSDSGAGHSAP